MKKIGWILVGLCILILSTVLLLKMLTKNEMPDDNAENAVQEEQSNEKENKNLESYSFAVQYIRTDGGYEEVEFPFYVLINSKEELDAYYGTNRNTFNLERREEVYSDSTIGFLDACDKYDESYFEKNNLLFLVLEEPSGSIRHRVTDVCKMNHNNEWVVSIERIIPEIGTDDLATWHLLLETQMGKVIDVNDKIQMNLTETYK